MESSMRQPLWIVNSALLVLLFITIPIVWLMQTKPPRWASIEPLGYEKPIKKQLPETVIAKIYENDLFGTYQKPITILEAQPAEAKLPLPPAAIATVMPQTPQPQFLEPLQLTVKGVIIAGDDQKNRALIEQAQTKQEALYNIGDRIGDAQLMRIFRNRVVFIRSNGQEEILYLREREAKDSPFTPVSDRWEGVIKKINDTEYIIEPATFITQIPSLASLITALDLLTVYRKGQPVGIRIGTLDPDSVGVQVGLQAGDVITKIDSMPVADLTQRFALYQKIISLPLGSSINVTLTRYQKPMTLTIKLDTLSKQPNFAAKVLAPTKTEEDIQEEKEQSLFSRHHVAPPLSEIRKHEKRVILDKVKRKERDEALKNRPIKQEI